MDGQLISLKACMEETERELAYMEEEYSREKEDMKQLIRFSHLEELTQEAVDVFIKKILVYRDKRVEIE